MAIDAGDKQGLFLDPAIRLWVLFPITVTMILVGVLRHYVTLLLNSSPKKQPLKAIREQQLLRRSAVLRANGSFFPPAPFAKRKIFLMQALESGSYLKDPPPAEGATPSTPPNPLTDPNAMEGMMDGLKKQAVMMVPQYVVMAWINFFFSRFVLIRLPFPLTLRFKSMLQRGIETPDLDVSWVSSLSWYFLNLFGLNSVFRLILGDENSADGTRDMQAMGGIGGAAMGGMPGVPAQDFVKLFAGEKDNLEIADHQWLHENVEERLLRIYKR